MKIQIFINETCLSLYRLYLLTPIFTGFLSVIFLMASR